jgi:hypothetical protein
MFPRFGFSVVGTDLKRLDATASLFTLSKLSKISVTFLSADQWLDPDPERFCMAGRAIKGNQRSGSVTFDYGSGSPGSVPLDYGSGSYSSVACKSTVEIKVFLNFLLVDEGSGSVQIITDPDPEDPNPSRSATINETHGIDHKNDESHLRNLWYWIEE